MAKGKRVRAHSPEVRQRIQTSILINRLQDNALGKLDPELTMGQIRSIEVLLKKTLPDLTAIRLTGAEGGPLESKVIVTFVDGGVVASAQ